MSAMTKAEHAPICSIQNKIIRRVVSLWISAGCRQDQQYGIARLDFNAGNARSLIRKATRVLYRRIEARDFFYQ